MTVAEGKEEFGEEMIDGAARDAALRDALSGAVNLIFMAVVYLVFGLSMLLQGYRWLHTPAYHNLFQVLPEQAWGAIYLAGGLLLLVAGLGHRHVYPWFTMIAVTVALMISVSWSFAFVVRVVTSNNTTPETFMSFLAFTFILVRGLMLMEHSRRTGWR